LPIEVSPSAARPIQLPCTSLPDEPLPITTPNWLPAMTLRSSAALPPMSTPLASDRLTPRWLPAALTPSAPRPIQLPAMVWPSLPVMSMPSCVKFWITRPRSRLPSDPPTRRRPSCTVPPPLSTISGVPA